MGTPPAGRDVTADTDLVVRATRGLLHARSVEAVVAVLRDFVETLGAQVVPAGEAGPGALPLDLALGHGSPQVAVTPRDRASDAGGIRLRLQRHLPTLVEDARVAAFRLRERDAGDTRADSRRPAPAPTGPHAGQAAFAALAKTGDVPAGMRLMQAIRRARGPGVDLVEEVLAPAAREVGRRWQAGHYDVTQEHLASAVIDGALSVCEHDEEHDGPVLALACAQGEWHTTPARMAAAQLRRCGFRVVFLGPSAPASDLVEHLGRLRPRALLVSATVPTALAGALVTVQAAHEAGIAVVVGGAAFGTDDRRARAVGAEGWAATPAGVAQVLAGLPAPGAAGDGRRAWREHARAREDRHLAVAVASQQLAVGVRKRGDTLTAFDLADDVGLALDFAMAAALVDDVAVMTEFHDWWRGAACRRVPDDLLEQTYRALAGVVGHPATVRVLDLVCRMSRSLA